MLHRVCDVARQKLCGHTVTLYLQDICPPNPTPPLCLVSACVGARKPDVRGISVEPLCNRPGLFRVRCEVVAPLSITVRDARGCLHEASDVLVLPQDALLRLPERAPYSIEAMAHAALRGDNWAGGTSFRTTFDIDVALYVAVIEAVRPGDTCCPPGCNCARCRCDRIFRLPLFPEG